MALPALANRQMLLPSRTLNACTSTGTRTSIETGMPHIARLTHLRELDLSNKQFTDDGLAHLGALVNLETLILGDTPITGTGFKNLASLNRLAQSRSNRRRSVQ